MKRQHLSALLMVILSLVCLSPSRAAAPETLKPIDAKLDQWDVEAAWTEVQARLAEEPKDADLLELASHVAFYRGDYEESLRLAKSGLENSGEDQGKKAFAALVESTVSVLKPYKRYETAHFSICLDDRQDTVLVSYVTDALERTYAVMAQQYGFRPAEKIRVEIFPDTKAFYYTSTLSARDIEVTGAVGLTKFNKLMILSPRALVHGYRWLDAISHEYMHFLITKLTANKAPIWFHEGLADHEETGWRGTPYQLSPVHQTLLARALESGRLISFDRMEPGLVRLDTPEDVQLAYAEAASAIDFIIVKGGHGAVQNVMKQMAVSDERGAADAIKVALGLSFTEFEGKWKEYLASRGLKEVEGINVRRYKIKEGLADDDRMEMREVKSMVARNRAHLGDLLRERGRTEAAVLEYQRALTDAHDSVPVLNRLSEALIELGKYDDALSFLERAKALAPDHPVTYANLGKVYLKFKDSKKAQEALENAIQINPFNPDVHQNLAIVYEMLGNKEAAGKEKEALNKLKK